MEIKRRALACFSRCVCSRERGANSPIRFPKVQSTDGSLAPTYIVSKVPMRQQAESGWRQFGPFPPTEVLLGRGGQETHMPFHPWGVRNQVGHTLRSVSGAPCG